MLWNGVLWIKFSSSTMEFYGLVEANDRFGVVGRFWFVGCGFMGVLCCSETQDRWWWLRRIGLGWWVGLDLWVMDLWVCCVVVKPQTGSGGGCEGLVGVLAMLLWWSPWRSLRCKAQIGPHGEAQIVSNGETSSSGCCEASGTGFVSVVKTKSVPIVKPHLYLSSIMLYWEFWWVFGKEMILDNNFGWIYNWFLWKNLGTNFGILWVSILLFLCLNILVCCSYVFMIKMNIDLNWLFFILFFLFFIWLKLINYYFLI